MRLARYVSGGSTPRLAVAATGKPFVDLFDAWVAAGGEPSSAALDSSAALIESGPLRWTEVADAARDAADSSVHLDVDGPDFRWLCPFDRINSLRDFITFEDHVARGAKRRGTQVSEYWYEAPVYYKGNHRQLLGPDEECPWPDYTERVDFELELAMVIGRMDHDISVTDADKYIFGFTVFDDFSARDIQAREMTAWMGPAKGKDFANAFGPCIVTADEVGPEPDLTMICRVNGEEWGRARSGAAHWRWSDVIAHASRAEEIFPTDVYGSGTPGGCCGLDLERELKPGDVVELEIERIGVLRNTIGERATPPAR